MISVVGYEGRRAADALASWGAAAIERGGELINGVTGRSISTGDNVVSQLVARGRLTVLDKPLELPARARVPEIVFQCRRQLFIGWGLGAYVGKTATLPIETAADNGDWATLIFKKKETFTTFRTLCAAALARMLLYPPGGPDSELGTVLSAGLVLSAHDPVLNAFRARQHPEDATWEKMCRASVQTEDGRSKFDDMLAGLRAAQDDDRWVLYYKSDDEEIKGLDSKDAASLFTALVKVNDIYSTTLKKEYPFLDKPPANHLDLFQAASARFEFTSAPGRSSPGEKIARYLEMRMLQDALNGKLPDDPKPELTEAIAVISKPPQYTNVQQSPMGENQLRPIAQTELVPDAQLPAPTWPRYSEPMTLLGYHSGTMDDARRIQLTLAPDCWRTMHQDEETTGSEAFRNARRTLYLPVILVVVREATKRGNYAYRLKSIELLGTEPRKLTALPSQLVRDAFIFDGRISASFQRSEGSLQIDGDSIEVGTTPTIDRAHEWMARFGELCGRRELAWTGKRLAPVVIRGVEKQDRTLLALRHFDGSATVANVLERLNEVYRHGLDVEAWLSRSIQSPYLKVDAGTISWTEKGRARSDALFRLTSGADPKRSFY